MAAMPIKCHDIGCRGASMVLPLPNHAIGVISLIGICGGPHPLYHWNIFVMSCAGKRS